MVPIEKTAEIIDAKRNKEQRSKFKGCCATVSTSHEGRRPLCRKLRLNEAIGDGHKFHRQASNVSRNQSHLFEDFAAQYLNFKVDSLLSYWHLVTSFT